MKKFMVVAPLMLALLAVGATDAQANSIRQGGKFGIGLGGGTASNGLSLKYFMSDGQALQANIGLNIFNGSNSLAVGADYLFEMPTFVNTAVVDLGWNIGAGVGVGLWDGGVGVGVSGVAGLEFLFVPLPVDLVLEWRPTVAVVPGVALDLIGFTGHIRFFF